MLGKFRAMPPAKVVGGLTVSWSKCALSKLVPSRHKYILHEHFSKYAKPSSFLNRAWDRIMRSYFAMLIDDGKSTEEVMKP